MLDYWTSSAMYTIQRQNKRKEYKQKRSIIFILCYCSNRFDHFEKYCKWSSRWKISLDERSDKLSFFGQKHRSNCSFLLSMRARGKETTVRLMVMVLAVWTMVTAKPNDRSNAKFFLLSKPHAAMRLGFLLQNEKPEILVLYHICDRFFWIRTWAFSHKWKMI